MTFPVPNRVNASGPIAPGNRVGFVFKDERDRRKSAVTVGRSEAFEIERAIAALEASFVGDAR